MQTTTLLMENVYLGVILVYINAMPLNDRSRCGDGWTYGRFLTGRGCLRPLSASYTRRHCLIDGNHLTLLSRDFYRDNIFCVKEHYYGTDVLMPSTAAPTTTSSSISLVDTKLSPDQLTDTKEAMAKSFGCCNAALQ